MTKKDIKRLKKELLYEAPINIGYSLAVMDHLPGEALVEALQELRQNGWFSSERNIPDWELRDILLGETVRHMGYQEFKKIAKYFFSYEMTEEEIQAEPISIPRRLYDELQANSNELLRYKQQEESRQNLENVIEQITYTSRKNDREVLAYNPIEHTLAVLEGVEHEVFPYFEDDTFLISDYRQAGSSSEQLARYLIENAGEKLVEHISTIYQNELTDIYWGDEERTQSFTKDELIEFLSGYLEPERGQRSEIDEQVVEELNAVLVPEGKEIVVHNVYGYSQGEFWTLSYMIDKAEMPNTTAEDIQHYLEHEVGAYYRGSLTEISLYNKDAEIMDSFVVDREELWGEVDSVEFVKERTQDTNFVATEVGIYLQEHPEWLENSTKMSEFLALDNRTQKELTVENKINQAPIL